jgi:probable F420-dependent oxidoreductase
LTSEVTFGVVLRGSPSRAGFRDVVIRAEALGCDVIAAPDHLGAPDPFATLTAAGQISRSVRLRTYVLNVGFWNPALLSRAAATTDVLSAGRVELGLGAGHMRAEYEDAGLPWHRHPARVEQLQATLREVRRRLTDPDHRPRPTQDRLPIAVGAMSSAALRIAAEQADIVAFSGLLQVPGAPAGSFTVASAAETERLVAEVRGLAAGRTYRSDALVQVVAIDAEPAIAAARLAADSRPLSTEQLLDTPFVLLARDPSHAAEIIAERHERFGFASFMTHEPNLEAFGEVISAYRR